MSHLALSALGRDRPGIVAEVTGVLVEHGVNVEDSRMAILRGQFAMVLLLSAPGGLDRRGVEEDLHGVRTRLGLEAVTLADLSEGDASPASGSAATHIVSVYGADHPGIVHAVAAALAERGVNITDLTTRLVDEPGEDPLYAMELEIALPGSSRRARSRARLRRARAGSRRSAFARSSSTPSEGAARLHGRTRDPALSTPGAQAGGPAARGARGPEIERVAADLVRHHALLSACVGVAAPQLAEPVRMVAVDVSEHPRAPESAHGLLVLVNPRVVAATGAEVAREGCLSIPVLTANVRRAVEVSVEAVSPSGGAISIASEGFQARCLQHEIDHLDGVLFLDRVYSLEHDVFRRRSHG